MGITMLLIWSFITTIVMFTILYRFVSLTVKRNKNKTQKQEPWTHSEGWETFHDPKSPQDLKRFVDEMLEDKKSEKKNRP